MLRVIKYGNKSKTTCNSSLCNMHLIARILQILQVRGACVSSEVHVHVVKNFTILLSILIGHINPQFFLLDMYTDYNAGVIEKIKAQRTSLGDLLFFSLFLEPALIAKSSLLLDVKPWDDETDMKKMEEEVRKITADGLLWGQGQWDILYNSYIFGAEF